MNISLLKTLDRFLGQMIVLVLPRPTTSEIDRPRSVLVIRPGGIGDAVLLVPVINILRKKIPGARIDVLAERRNAQIFQLCPAVTNTFCYDRPGAFLKVLFRRYDIVIDTEQWHRLSAIVARLIRSHRKIGFATNERARMLTDVIGYSHDDYEALSFSRLTEPLVGRSVIDCSAAFLILPDDVKPPTALHPELSSPYVVMFPGASIAERKWGADRFAALAELVVTEFSKVVIVGGAEDIAVGEAIAARCPEVINMVGKTSLVETASILQGSTLLVSGDSGVLHIGVGLGVPTVSLFGPGIAKKWAPKGKMHRVINLELPCSPCTRFGTTSPCSIGAKCIQDISVEQVFSAIQDLLP